MIFCNSIEICENNSLWTDSEFGDGTDNCNTLTFNLCYHPDKPYAIEAQNACAKACGRCPGS